MVRLAGFGFFAALTALGCYSADTASRRHFERLNEEIQENQAQSERPIDSLAPVAASAPSGAQGASTTPPAPSQVDRSHHQVVHLTDGEDRSDTESANGEGSDTKTVIRAVGAEAPSVRDAPRDREADRRESAQADYDRALATYRANRTDQALEAFAAFLVKYPDDPLADNATFWRGECFYAKGEYRDAAAQYEVVITKYPKGNKAPDAMLKLGLSQRRMGARDKAEETFRRLRTAYPESEAAKKIPRE